MSGQVDSIVVVSITATSAQPTVGNFGTPLFIQYHTHNTDKVRTYTDLAGMVTDGFSVYEPAYLWATKVLSQNPHPPEFKIGRGTTAVAQHMTFVAATPSTGDTVGMTLALPTGTSVTATTTAVSGWTASNAASALGAIIGSVSGVASTTVTSASIAITWTTAGNIVYPSTILGGAYTDDTASSSPGTDLDAIKLVDDDFYGVTGAIMSKADITAVAVWVAANKKTHYYTTADDDNRSGVSAGVMHDLNAAGYKRSYGQWSGTPAQYGASALEALEFTYDPGTYTDAFKGLEGITIDSLTATQRGNITTNSGNYYVNIGGVNATFDGRSAQGQFMDLTRFLDALENDIQVRVFTLLVNLPKVPYDSIGYGMIGAEIGASLASFVLTGALSNDPDDQPKVVLPLISDASSADRLARTARGFKFSCLYTSAIQKVLIQGVVNV